MLLPDCLPTYTPSSPFNSNFIPILEVSSLAIKFLFTATYICIYRHGSRGKRIVNFFLCLLLYAHFFALQRRLWFRLSFSSNVALPACASRLISFSSPFELLFRDVLIVSAWCVFYGILVYDGKEREWWVGTDGRIIGWMKEMEDKKKVDIKSYKALMVLFLERK